MDSHITRDKDILSSLFIIWHKTLSIVITILTWNNDQKYSYYNENNSIKIQRGTSKTQRNP